jgi:hypothetical protein
MPVVGFLNSGSHEERAHLVSAFKQGLSETGHIEGRNVAIEYRWAEGQYDRLPAQAAEFVRRPVPSRNGAPKAQICDADHRRARRDLLYRNNRHTHWKKGTRHDLDFGPHGRRALHRPRHAHCAVVDLHSGLKARTASSAHSKLGRPDFQAPAARNGGRFAVLALITATGIETLPLTREIRVRDCAIAAAILGSRLSPGARPTNSERFSSRVGSERCSRLPARLCQPRIPEDRKERSASAVRKRIGPALAIVDDESLDGHGLHCVRGDANSGMADAGCGAEQDHALLRGERRRRLHDTA